MAKGILECPGLWVPRILAGELGHAVYRLYGAVTRVFVDSLQALDRIRVVTRKPALLATAVWAFVVSPVLCMGGLMSHACGPHDDHGKDAAASCRSADCSCGDTSEPCSHESDCSSDPCRLDVTTRETHHSFVNEVIGDPFAVPALVVDVLLRPEPEHGLRVEPFLLRPSGFVDHPAILPLLI